MHTHKQLIALVQAGKHPVITFTKAAEDLESYVEPGMKAKVQSVRLDHDDVLIITVDYSQFENHNKQFESFNYYDKSGAPCLNAREAGYYKVIDTVYVMVDGTGPETFSIDDEAVTELFKAYQAVKTDVSYVTWLEQRVALYDKVVEQAVHVVNSADDAGCSEDLTVVDVRDLNRLDNAIAALNPENDHE